MTQKEQERQAMVDMAGKVEVLLNECPQQSLERSILKLALETLRNIGTSGTSWYDRMFAGVRFAYIRQPMKAQDGKEREAVVTAAYTCDGDFLRAAFAYCSPGDQFCRSDGRLDAARRLFSGKRAVRGKGHHMTTGVTVEDDGRPPLELVGVAFNKETDRPGWCRKWTVGVVDGKLTRVSKPKGR